MSLHRTLLAGVVLTFVLWGLILASSEAAPVTRRSVIVQAVERAKPAVVNIHSERTTGGLTVPEPLETLPTQQRSNGMGTGIIIDPRGYIITNHHVVEDVSLLRVRLSDGTPHIARVVDREKEYDLALLKIDANRPLPIIPVGTSSDLMVGETVVAIGNAYGYEHTVTVGVISALNRDVTLNKEISYKQLIQTDASINPGNSGGPLLNIDGELVGVNVAIRAGAQGIGFAIPTDQMVQVVTDMLARRRKTDVSPGLGYRNRIDLRQSPPWSMEVERVEATGPAARAGIKNGDVIVRLGDVEVHNSLDFERALLNARPGDNFPIKVRRPDGEQQLALILQPSLSAGSPNDLAWRRLGVRLAPAPADVLARAGSKLNGGLLVTEVNLDGPGYRSGIQRGDVLVGLHKWETIDLESIRYVFEHQELATFYPLKLFLLRGGQVQKGYVAAE
jgi:serine protease Do